MKYLLDTNIISYALRDRDHALMERLREVGRAQVGTSVLVQVELEYGARLRGSATLRASVRAFLGGLEVLPLTPEDGTCAAEVAASLRAKGRPIGTMDTLIAGHAKRRGLTLVTHNVRHFQEVEGLAVEDWSTGK